MSSNDPRRPRFGRSLQTGGRRADVPSLANRANVRPNRAAELGLWMLLAVAAALSTGCGLLAQQTQAPRPSTTVQGFMQQPRPGNGVIGP